MGGIKKQKVNIMIGKNEDIIYCNGIDLMTGMILKMADITKYFFIMTCNKEKLLMPNLQIWYELPLWTRCSLILYFFNNDVSNSIQFT